jgi:hypothetical protein
MFRKVSLRILLYILVALTCLTVITQLSEKMNGDRSFRSQLASFDTAQVTGVVLSDLKSGNKGFELIKAGNGWKMKANGREYRTDDNYIRSMIWGISQLKAERIAASNENKWKEFEVTDSLALRVTLKGKSKVLADLLVGKFNYQSPAGSNPFEQQGNMTTYIRVADEQEVYAVNGFIRGEISPEINRFRDKTIVRIRSGSLRKLTFQYPADSSLILEKQGNLWTINGVPADSANVVQYINSMENLTEIGFTDDSPLNGPPVFKLTIESDSALPAEVMAYASETANGYIITSSMNPGAQFSGNNGLTGKIFKGKPFFLK